MSVLVLVCAFSILMLSQAQSSSSGISSQLCQPAFITVTSRRNQTGQLITEVGMNRDKSSPPLSIKTELCETADRVITWVTISVPEPRAGPKDYELLPGLGYYKYHLTTSTWPIARQACANEGAHLVIINSEVESNAMSQLLSSRGTLDWAWIGGHELGTFREFFTIFGVPLNATGFSRWHPGQPSESRKEGDNGMVVNKNSGGLGDAYPTWTVGFICEFEL